MFAHPGIVDSLRFSEIRTHLSTQKCAGFLPVNNRRAGQTSRLRNAEEKICHGRRVAVADVIDWQGMLNTRSGKTGA
ncbi:MAG TPA: hypothetical protein DHW07_04265, partial [Gammaproteobacteria bacterium]|nr:hypothetical protein [Gammaproteobacteria bacterium]